MEKNQVRRILPRVGDSKLKELTLYICHVVSYIKMKLIDADSSAQREEIVNNDLQLYQLEILKSFISQKCQAATGIKQPAGQLCAAYKSFCDESGYLALKQGDFKSLINTCGYMWQKTYKGAFYIGLQLTDPEEFEKDQKYSIAIPWTLKKESTAIFELHGYTFDEALKIWLEACVKNNKFLIGGGS